HWIDWRYRSKDQVYNAIVDSVHRDGGAIVPAHPHCPFVGCRWKFGYHDSDAVEVWNGPWTIDDEISVGNWDNLLGEAGRSGSPWLPALGNSDAHSVPQVIGLPHNVMQLDSLSRDAVVSAIAAGDTYIAESSQVSLAVSANGDGRAAGIGDRLAVSPTT